MAVQLAGGTNIYASFIPANASALVDKLETDLVSAGWSIISGAGTDAIVFESAANNDGGKIRVVTDVASTPSRMRLKLRNEGATVTTANYAGILAPDGAETWILLANKFGFCLFAVGGYATARKYVLCANLYVPALLASTVVSDVGFMIGDAQQDNTTKRVAIGRNVHYQPTNSPLYSTLFNGAVVDGWNINSGTRYNGYIGFPTMCLFTNPSAVQTLDFASGDLPIIEALVSWGGTGPSDPGRIRGQMYDCIAVCGAFNELDEITVGGNDFVAITHQNSGATDYPPWTLFWYKP